MHLFSPFRSITQDRDIQLNTGRCARVTTVGRLCRRTLFRFLARVNEREQQSATKFQSQSPCIRLIKFIKFAGLMGRKRLFLRVKYTIERNIWDRLEDRISGCVYWQWTVWAIYEWNASQSVHKRWTPLSFGANVKSRMYNRFVGNGTRL